MKHAIILIDIQNDYFENGRNPLFCPKKAAYNAGRALDYCRRNKFSVYHVRHISLKEEATFFLPETFGSEIYESVKPFANEKVFIKNTPNSFFHTGLAEELAEKKIDHITVCGMMSHMCIDTSVRAARDLGINTVVLQDACATKDLIWDNKVIPAATVHDTIMASLQGTFAQVMMTEIFILNNFPQNSHSSMLRKDQ